MSATRSFTDIMRPPEINIAADSMRATIKRLQEQGFKGRYLSLALLEVLSEVAHEDSPAWAGKFYRILRDLGEEGVMTGRLLSGMPVPADQKN